MFVAELLGAARPAWTPHEDPRLAALAAGYQFLLDAAAAGSARTGTAGAGGAAVRVALYARVSTERQADRGTIGSQLALLREHVAAAGDELVGEYVDDGHSGARLDRPGLDALRDAAEAGLVRTGVVPVAGPARPRLRLPGAGARRAGPLRGHACAFTDAPDLAADDPQATLLTQVQGVIAEYEKAKIAERYRRGKLFRARAGEIVTWKTAYGYRRIARSAATGPAHLEIYEPEAAVVRRIFTDRAAGITVREICRRLNADAGTVADRQAHLGRTPRCAGCCATRPTSAGSTSTAPNRCPTGAPPAAPGRSRATATTGSPSTAPASSPTSCSRPPAESPPTTASGARAAPNPASGCCKGLVKCGVCGVGTNCHKMRGRNGTWHRYYYCRNHDPIRAGGEDRRCPERNIRADALDAFVFDQIRAALLHPDLLLAGEQAVAVHHPDPRRRTARRRTGPPGPQARRRRRRTAPPRRPLPGRAHRAARTAAPRRRRRRPPTRPAAQANQPRRRNEPRSPATTSSAAACTTSPPASTPSSTHLDDAQKQQLLRLLIEDVRVTGWHVQIRLRIPLDHPTRPPRQTSNRPPAPAAPLSTEDGLRSVGEHQRPQLPTTRPRYRQPPQHQNAKPGKLNTPTGGLIFGRHNGLRFERRRHACACSGPSGSG